MAGINDTIYDTLDENIFRPLDDFSAITYADYPLLSDLADGSSFGNTGTIARASSKILVPESTLIQVSTLGNNVAAFPGSGVQVQASHTNSFTYSQQFDHANWVNVSSTVVANTSVAPDGTTTMDEIKATSAVGPRVKQLITGGGDHCLAVFAAPGTNLDHLYLGFSDNVSMFSQQWFDVNLGIVGSYSGSGVTKLAAFMIPVYGGGYWCCFIGNFGFFTNHVTIAGSTTDNALTAATNDTIKVWQADYTDKDTLMSPVLTTTAAATCLADIITIPVTHFPANDFTASLDYKDGGNSSGGSLYDQRDVFGDGCYMTTGINTFQGAKFISSTGYTTTLAQSIVRDDTYATSLTLSSSDGVTLDVDAGTDNDNSNLADIVISTDANIGSDYADSNIINGQLANFKVISI